VGLRFLRFPPVSSGYAPSDRNRIASLSDVPRAAADVLRGDRCIARCDLPMAYNDAEPAPISRWQGRSGRLNSLEFGVHQFGVHQGVDLVRYRNRN
jgi:hypothetical protein